MTAFPAKGYGDEYPQAITIDGVRSTLRWETRWSRYFEDAAGHGMLIPRFMDGSASVTAREIEAEWPAWSQRERDDFCEACGALTDVEELAGILRYVMRVGGPDEWFAVALDVARILPMDEAFELLAGALLTTGVPMACNITQGIAATKHPDAPGLLSRHLEQLWSQPQIWEHDDFTNWTAFDATMCIEGLLELGASPSDFESRVRQLSEHSCAGNRQSCRTFLTRYYPWLSRT
ncbi:MAG TPA: hypothetical protein VN634_16660 [Candidatus Limnocylindrales bacterium]|nr:hypothetical protein [Candidatus Limnocylindrales bacterium]